MYSRVFGLLLFTALATASAQDASAPIQLADRGPAFFTVVRPGAPRVDARSATIFRRFLKLDLRDATVPDALRAIEDAAGVHIAYPDNLIPQGARVTVRAEQLSLDAALTAALHDVPADVQLGGDGTLLLVRRGAAPIVPAARHQATGGVTGRVTDAKTGASLADVAVTVGRTSLTVRSAADGSYTVHQIPVGEVALTFRHLGYLQAARTALVADSVVHLNVALEPSPAVLDQVVTTVTGRQQLRSIGNAISTINADSLVPNTPVTNLGDIINARAPGVQVINAEGVTGASPVIYIRGAGSLSQSTQPLVYIDGVRVSNSYAGSPSFQGGTAGHLNDVAPDDIASIEIVKGPSAATLYGTDAANGVILITTKHGEGGGTRWNVYGEGGVLTADPTSIPYNYTGWGHAPGSSQEINSCTLVAVAQGACIQDSVTHFNPLRVGSLTPLGTGNRGEGGAQVSGGDTRGLRYFLSGDYTSEVAPLQDPEVYGRRALDSLVGPAIGKEYVQHPNSVGKYDGRLNLITPVGKNADVSISASYLSQSTQIPEGGATVNAAGGAGYRDQFDGWPFGIGPDYVLSFIASEKTEHFTGAATSHWTPIEWLSARATVGLDESSDGFVGFQPADAAPIDFNPGGRVYDQQGTTTLYSVDLGATARLPLTSRLVSSTSIGAQYHRTDIAMAVAAANQLTSGATSVSGGVPSASQIDTQSVVAGAYAEEQLALNDRLFLTGAVRIDGANDFGQQFNTATYPKGAISWLVSRESFFPTWHWLSLWRLRGAYGESGTQPGVVLTTLQNSLVTVDGTSQVGTGLFSLGNPHVQPERQKEIEAGSDLDLIDNRIHAEFTYYLKRNVNALYDVPTGASLGTGLGAIEENIGAINNWGYEALLSVALVSARPFSWDVAFNGSINHNRVVTLGPYFQPLYGQFGNNSIVAGYPVFSMFAQPYTYHDANGNGIIEPDEVTVSTVQQFLGPTIPSRQLTAATHIGLFDNHVRIGAQFDYRGGFVIPDNYLSTQCEVGTAFASNVRGAPLGDQAVCLADANGGTNFGLISDGSFIRFRELSLTYVAPGGVAQRLRARTLSVTLSARNLALWTHFPGGDPESAPQTLGFPQNDVFAQGGGVPASQYWLVRANIGF